VPRYLLADEVGLGKTIEAGVVIRQFVLDHPDAHRVLIVMPMALKAQWISELANRCTVGERFGHRIRFVALEELAEAPEKDLDAELVVVDDTPSRARLERERQSGCF
jgi:ATP-dependent helicase HepA